jgi:hypothetical protein
MSSRRKGAKDAKKTIRIFHYEGFSLRPLRLCGKHYYFEITRAISSTLFE